MTIATRWYPVLGVLCFLAINLIGAFAGAVAAGVIVVPLGVAFVVPPILSTLSLIAILLRGELPKLLPGVDLDALGTSNAAAAIAGIAAAGGLPESMLAPRDPPAAQSVATPTPTVVTVTPGSG